MTNQQSLRTHYRTEKGKLMQTIGSPKSTSRQVRKVLHQLSDLADSVLIQLWEAAGLGSPMALIAVGGFGRGEMFPFSDVDVLVLLPDGQSINDDEQLKSRVEDFIGSCWDTGLEIGSSVRTLADCLLEADKASFGQSGQGDNWRI